MTRFAARRTAPFLTNGGKEICITPEKETGGTACRGTGSTTDGISHEVLKCKQKPGLTALLLQRYALVKKYNKDITRFPASR